MQCNNFLLCIMAQLNAIIFKEITQRHNFTQVSFACNNLKLYYIDSVKIYLYNDDNYGHKTSKQIHQLL